MVDVNDFFGVVIRPDEVLPKFLKKVDVSAADKTYAIIGAILGLIFGLLVALAGAFASVFAASAGLQQLVGIAAGLGVLAIIIFPILGAIVVVIGSRFSAWLQAKFTRLFNGLGSFENTYYLASRMVWPLVIANILVNIVAGIIPIIGGLIAIAWWLYSVYLTITLLSIANKVSKLQALAALIIGVIVVGIIAAVLIVILTAVILGSVIGAAQ